MGVVSYKIEGRLKSPEYVAAVTKVYRRALDDAITNSPTPASEEERYRLEMTFSRGQSNGWLEGTNHPQLTHGKWGKKRGPLVGVIAEANPDNRSISLINRTETPIKAGDGFVIDEAHESTDRNQEQGAKAFKIKGEKIVFDKRNKLNWKRIKTGQMLYKTSDPSLEKSITSEWKSARPEEKGLPLTITVSGSAGEPLTLTCNNLSVSSQERLELAHNRPLTTETLVSQLSKMGGTAYDLGKLYNELPDNLSLPLSAINRTRRALVEVLEKDANAKQKKIVPTTWKKHLVETSQSNFLEKPRLQVLCRHLHQIETALDKGITHLYADFEEINGYKEAVKLVREHDSDAMIALATPRIQKSGEHGYFKHIENCAPDGVLIRNLGALDYFAPPPHAHVSYGALCVLYLYE